VSRENDAELGAAVRAAIEGLRPQDAAEIIEDLEPETYLYAILCAIEDQLRKERGGLPKLRPVED
jgi:hypothetical protein